VLETLFSLAHEETWTASPKIFDPEDYSFYYLQCEKFGSEGQFLFKTTNLFKGFLQRFDNFRKHAFDLHYVIGDEPNLEIDLNV
jgi:hypothetical protein